jgi:hypothetical protein
MDVGAILLSTWFAGLESSRYVGLFVAGAVALVAPSVGRQKWEVYWNTVRIGPQDVAEARFNDRV